MKHESRTTASRTRASLLALVLVVGCTSTRPSGSPGDVRDAGRPYDWTSEYLPPLVVGCGDGTVDLGESCDDANSDPHDGCDQCRWTSLCGNGRREGAETCDDGNRVNGDGCRASCQLEQCGDGLTDAPEEACDGSPQGCSGCAAALGCGDGDLVAPESCDDGNTADWDGCSAACETEEIFMLTELGFATDPALGCDVTGTGALQNAAGRALAVAAIAWNAQLARQFRDSTERPAIALAGWQRGTALPERLRMAMFDAVLVDPLARVVSPAGLSHDYVHATVEGERITSGVADIFLDAAGAVVVEEPLRGARFDFVARPDGVNPQRLEGTVCGVLEVQSLARAMDLFGSGTATPYPLCQTMERAISLADLVGAGRRLGFVPTQPDTDLDGDGLEQLIIAGVPADSCTPVIVGCVEGDGTETLDPNCVFDFDDGWSASFFVVAERATFATP
ncbi:MAG: DUF4215 domain-containing protein [Myxococcales bacterium]|nr:DUF4215 domain-containing protein [Myxococcales bacterium]